MTPQMMNNEIKPNGINEEIENEDQKLSEVKDTEVKEKEVTDKEAVDSKVELSTKKERPKIQKHLIKPAGRKTKKKYKRHQKEHEKAFEKRLMAYENKASFKYIGLISIILLLGIVLLSRTILTSEMTGAMERWMLMSLVITVALMIISLVILFKDAAEKTSFTDPITDFFIIRRGRVIRSTRHRHFNRINSRFMMVTFLKLYQKDALAIVDENFVYANMDESLSKDEITLLNFMLDHGIKSIDDFVEVLSTETHDGKIKDHFYRVYKEAIIEMADDQNYINPSIKIAKNILRAGAIFFALIVLVSLSKGQGSILTWAVYSLQSIILFLASNITYANSKAAHVRIKALKKERRLLQSSKVEVYTALIYSYIFAREDKVIKRMQRAYQQKELSDHEYQKFSESYNTFQYILIHFQNE